MVISEVGDSGALAYLEVRELELLLRRVVRWELMARYGRQWFNALDELSEVIQDRERVEKLANLYDGNASELSYLSLGELLNLIFRRKWHEIFRSVFTNERGLEKELFREIIPLRNKVAHFRPTTVSDLRRLRLLSELKETLSKYYSHSNLIDAYLSSDPELANEQIDEESLSLIRALSSAGHHLVWLTYGEIECLRARGFNLGIGLYCSSVFLEIRCPLEPKIWKISDWSHRERFSVSFTTIENKVIRIFWPLSLPASEIRKSMLSLQKLVGHLSVQEDASKKESSFSENIITRENSSTVGMVF